MDLFQLLYLAGFLIISASSATSSSILTKLKNRVCSSKYGSRISMCKGFHVDSDTTTKPTTSRQDSVPVTIETIQDDPINPQDLVPVTIVTPQEDPITPQSLASVTTVTPPVGSIIRRGAVPVLIDKTIDIVKKIHSRIGVLITEFTRQAVMSRGPDGVRVDDDRLTIKKSTQLTCASECISDDSCLGFAYSQPNKQCQLMSETTLESGEFIDESGWRIYYL